MIKQDDKYLMNQMVSALQTRYILEWIHSTRIYHTYQIIAGVLTLKSHMKHCYANFKYTQYKTQSKCIVIFYDWPQSVLKFFRSCSHRSAREKEKSLQKNYTQCILTVTKYS